MIVMFDAQILDSLTISVALHEVGLPARVPVRPVHLRQPDFDQQFDEATLFYDVFWRTGRLYLLGPPVQAKRKHQWVYALKLLARMSVNGVPAGLLWPRLKFSGKCLLIEIRAAKPGPVIIGGHRIHPSGPQFFTEGRKFFYTKQKDESPDAIRSWIDINWHLHRPDGFVIYDDRSTRYDLPELASRLRGLPCAVYLRSFNFLRGPSAWQGSNWDSDFSQYGALEHVRHAHLPPNALMVNCDIDEIIEPGGVFEQAERHAVVRFKGRWVYCEDPDLDGTHLGHTIGELDAACPFKWVVNLARLPWKASLEVHSVSKADDVVTSETVYRHHRGVNSSWKYDRSGAHMFDPTRHMRMTPLR